MSNESARSMTTRSMGREVRPPSSSLSTPSDSNAGIIALTALFESPSFPNEPPDDTLEFEEDGDVIPEMDDQLQCFDEVITNIQAAAEPPTSPTSSKCSASTVQSTVNPFRQEFGTPTGNTRAALDHLVQPRTQLYRPIIDKEIRAIPCSTLSRHLWAHCQDIDFPCKEAVSAWCRKTLQLEFLSTGSALSYMKSAGTKKCALSMKERITLFHHFGKRNLERKN
mmetsp:Transcript_19516/g.36467  ORF Transcript_19516/g.36467 Transcript_19516/m.36467 type:complete len:224 (+) Transcript_19516:1881-2552(+)